MLSFYCFLGYVITKQMNSNKHYITASCIPCNNYSYSYVITVTVYQMYSKFLVESTKNAPIIPKNFPPLGKQNFVAFSLPRSPFSRKVRPAHNFKRFHYSKLVNNNFQQVQQVFLSCKNFLVTLRVRLVEEWKITRI